MSILNINNQENFKSLITKNYYVIVHFYANWVEQCQHMDNILEELRNKVDYKKVTFAKLAAEDVPEISLKYDITAVPTLVLFRGGEKYEIIHGANPEDLVKKIKSMLSIEVEKKSPEKIDENSPSLLTERLKRLINAAPVMLFIKGNAVEQRCGFSRQIVELINSVDVQFKTFDILSDNDVREGLKKYSDWPTYPQLYVNGELIGGLDIVKELANSGDLKEIFAKVDKSSEDDLQTSLKNLINKSNVMIFMKGNREAPRCKFSKQLMELMSQIGVDFETFDILQDETVRQGLKDYSKWPTYPQIYVKGELIGGLDICKEMHESGELKNVLSN